MLERRSSRPARPRRWASRQCIARRWTRWWAAGSSSPAHAPGAARSGSGSAARAGAARTHRVSAVAQITVAIVAWNTRDLLDACLASLPAGLEVWVVDNGSQDGSVAMVRSRHPDVRVVESPRNLGF